MITKNKTIKQNCKKEEREIKQTKKSKKKNIEK
jgi:hypothetical protein